LLICIDCTEAKSSKSSVDV